jgi:hypothetical protein
MGNIFLALAVSCGLLTGLVTAPESARACRDCPFPTPLASMHWLMPSGHSEVMVEEINLGRGQIRSVVRLVDAITGDLLAIGKLDHAKGRKRITVQIFDMTGGKMEAELYYTNQQRDRVHIKITCDRCNVDPFYLK